MASPDAHGTEPIPEHNRPGHHPDQEQDKPDLAAFAKLLGVPPSDDTETSSADTDIEDAVVAPAIPISKGRQPRLPAEPLGGAEPHVPVDHLTALPDLRQDRTRPSIVAGPAVHPAPASPVDPAAVVGEVLELGVRFAVSVALLPARLAAASARAVIAAVTHDADRR